MKVDQPAPSFFHTTSRLYLYLTISTRHGCIVAQKKRWKDVNLFPNAKSKSISFYFGVERWERAQLSTAYPSRFHKQKYSMHYAQWKMKNSKTIW